MRRQTQRMALRWSCTFSPADEWFDDFAALVGLFSVGPQAGKASGGETPPLRVARGQR